MKKASERTLQADLLMGTEACLGEEMVRGIRRGSDAERTEMAGKVRLGMLNPWWNRERDGKKERSERAAGEWSGRTTKDAFRHKEGFTLVELIVVLVILAILAAIMVPSLLGYIGRARQQQKIQTAHAVQQALQAGATGLYAEGKPITTLSTAESGFKIADIEELIDAGDTKIEQIQFNVKSVTETADESTRNTIASKLKDDKANVNNYAISEIAIKFDDDNNWYVLTSEASGWQVQSEGLTDRTDLPVTEPPLILK